MNAYLNTLTVKTLREIAKQAGFQFISRKRKAELIELIIAEIATCHGEAIREDTERSKPVAPFGSKISRMDYPVPFGRPVTEAHVKICKEYGHVSYVIDNVDQGMCPRCGESTKLEWDDMSKDALNTIHGMAIEENISQEKDAIDSVTTIVQDAINALTPLMEKAKAAFENARDNGGSEELVDATYQAYIDIHRSIEEYTRTLAYLSDTDV